MHRVQFSRVIQVAALFLAMCSDDRAQQAGEIARHQFSRSQELLFRGNLDAALAAAREGLKLAPRSVEGLNLLGIILDQEQQYSDAETAFRQALKLDPRSTITHNNLGKSYVLTDKPDLAQREFEASLRLNPLDPAANYNLGSILLAKGDARGAIGYLERVKQGDESTSLTLVKAYLSANETSKAEMLSNALSNQYRDNPQVHFSLGVTFASKKQYPVAIRELELANALTPGTFEILHNLGEAYLRNGKNARAEETLNRALALKPNSVDTIYLLAQAEADDHKYLDALDLLQRARTLDPANADILFLTARIDMVQNLYQDAVAVLEEGVNIAPAQPDLRAALGESYIGAGRVDRALEQFKILMQLDASATSLAFMGIAYRQLGRFDEAKKYLLQGLAKDPHNAACLYNLGFIAEKQGDDAQATKWLSAALAEEPDFPEAIYSLASVYMRQRRYAQAIPLLQRCTSSAPYAARAYYKLAAAERSLKRDAAANRDLRMFETLARHRAGDPIPVQDFEAVTQRVALQAEHGTSEDLAEIERQVKEHPNNPRSLYFLAEAYLKLGNADAARLAIARLDQLSGADYRSALGIALLFIKYRLYPDAIYHLQQALTANPLSDDATYDLAYAYLQAGDYAKALENIQRVSPDGQKHDNYLALLGDIFARLGRTSDATHALEDAVRRSPENDRYVLLLALTQLRADRADVAKTTIGQGLTHVPDSGYLLWGRGVVAAMTGRNDDAERDFARAIDLLPDWPAAYALFNLFYGATGQHSKAQQMLDRYHVLFGNEQPEMKPVRHELEHATLSETGPIQLSAEAKLGFIEAAIDMAKPL